MEIELHAYTYTYTTQWLLALALVLLHLQGYIALQSYIAQFTSVLRKLRLRRLIFLNDQSMGLAYISKVHSYSGDA